MIRLFARLVEWVDDQSGLVKVALLVAALALSALVARTVCSQYVSLSYYTR